MSKLHIPNPLSTTPKQHGFCGIFFVETTNDLLDVTCKKCLRKWDRIMESEGEGKWDLIQMMTKLNEVGDD